MVKISSVEARTLRIPLDAPVAFSTRKISARYFTLLRIHCDDGSSGLGFCQGGASYGHLATDIIRHVFRPRLLGDDPYRVEGIWSELYQDALLNGRQGVVVRALSAVDFALWDRNARAHGLPLWRYLGSTVTDSVRAYASGGYYGQDKGVEDLVAETTRQVAAGFDAVKIKIGRAAPGLDEERVAAVREAVGPDVEIMLDANNAWNDLATALRWLRRLEPFDATWIEEPFGPDDVTNHARLRQQCSIPVASGEIVAGRWAHQRLLESGAVDVLQPDAGVCGGVTEFRRIASQAAGFGIPIAPHSLQGVHIHLLAAAPNGMILEYFEDDAIQPFWQLFDARLEVADGRARLPTRPGFGFDLDEERVEEYAQGKWE